MTPEFTAPLSLDTALRQETQAAKHLPGFCCPQGGGRSPALCRAPSLEEMVTA